ncbi:high affinity cGMP-specific 3',5'-cyclic phosphodiesterase 9A-like isoform X2 [Phyllopteryx taeniolatus]|uniref:high affinity cGMP-specific 3',5'-cyclic phosphodiesterase 9A-like isoform X2 n=1 Tax=Phyllopteryx taeniolatus TaxID=161469 RepID=UPI002AD3126C|nr:high affinity cGMP-specific 3',5'-cyclic phosphodiesterase 9A-like isoform X2 [Phyllopteryx taeniolatus]
MATKIIHFIVNGRVERAEFGADCTAEDVKDLFRAAAEASPHHILKLYKANGSVVKISPMLEPNSHDSYYRLEVVASDFQSITMPTDVDNMEHRLCHLETKVLEEAGKTPEIIRDLKSQMESFKRKLESVKHLSWMGLFKDDSTQQLPKFPPKAKGPQLNMEEEHQQVRTKFFNMSSLQVTEDVIEHLKTPIFDNWQWEAPEMLVLLQVMFTDLDFLTVFHVEVDVLQNFLFEVYRHYNNIPFHNFQHCFCVTQMEESNILKHLTTEQYKHMRAGIIKCILATDMARHNEILNKFKTIQPVFDFRNKDHKEVLMKIMLKVSDISNEARPMAVAEPWLDCLLQEFFNQSDTEKLKGLPVTPFMDRDKVSKPSSQTSFIRFVLMPLFTELTKLFPCLEVNHFFMKSHVPMTTCGHVKRFCTLQHSNIFWSQ